MGSQPIFSTNKYKRVTIYLLDRVKKKKNIRKKLGVIHNNNQSMDEHLDHLIKFPLRKASTQRPSDLHAA